MTNVEIPAPLKRAWAAGLFEGKCKIYPRQNELYFDHQTQAVLERFKAVTGTGFIRDIPMRARSIHRTYRWQTKSLEDTRKTLLFVLPLLGPEKAAQAAQLIKRIEGNPAWQRQQAKKANS